jgi:hypothetical protein
MLEFSEKPLTRASAVPSAGGNPDPDGHDRSVAGLRGQARRPPACPGRPGRVRRCPSGRRPEPVIRRDAARLPDHEEAHV